MKLRRLSLGLSLLVLTAPGLAVSQDEDAPEFLPGLVATYTGVDGKPHTRLDPAVAFAWRDAVPEGRLPPGKFSARWRGRLLVVAPGAYRFHVYAAGTVRLRINGDELLAHNSPIAAWAAAPQRELPYGFHEVDLDFAQTGEQPRLSLYWEGPQFQLEPVPDRHLFHDPAIKVDQQFERGRLLSRALRCSACHQIPGESAPLTAPALTHLNGNISPVWITDWLTAAHSGPNAPGAPHEMEAIDRRMPHFALSRPEAEAIVDYLLANSLRAAPPERPKFAEPPPTEDQQRDKQKKKKRDSNERKPDPPSARVGAAIVRTVGCLACHRVGETGEQSLFDGGDLGSVADKRPAAFFEAWLLDPAKLNPTHRMPVFRLSNDELKSLSLYLATLSAGTKSQAAFAVEVQPTARGKKNQSDAQRFIVEQRCGACHQLPSQAPAFDSHTRLALSASPNWGAACSGPPDARQHRPGYNLSAEDQAALQGYLAATITTPSNRSVAPDGALLLAERNCLSCHARGLGEGIAPRLQTVVAADPDLQPLLPAMSPPALTGVGDKLHDEALVAAITLKTPPLRPWLKIRMPRFDLSPQELHALVGHLVDADRVPDLPVSPPAEPDETAMLLAGRRLVTSDGFGCTSCHQIGNVSPPSVTLAAHGSSLSLLGSRIRRPWFDRWVRDPARIVPRMEMPSIKLPIQGVLENRVDGQLAAVWRILNEPGFNPPPPNPVRIVRRQNVPGPTEPAVVLTDVLEADDLIFIKPLLIGLSNRHNVLFDLETNRLAGWWIGDAARQRTRAKTWYWEPGGTHLLKLDDDSSHHAPRDVPPSKVAVPSDGGVSESILIRDGKQFAPQIQGQFPTEFDWFEHLPDGIRFSQRLRFGPNKDAASSVQLSLIQAFSTAVTDRSPGGFTGFRRRVEVAGLSPGAELRLYLLPASGGASRLDPRTIEQPDAARNSQLRVHSVGSHELALDSAGRPYLTLKAASPTDRPGCELEYLCELPIDSFLGLPLPPKTQIAQPLDAVPGFDAVALPAPDVAMPIALAWRNDGTLVVGSLEGRVWLARDTDGDELEDSLTPFSDELASPYGLAVHGDAIDVASKYALLRLHDRDGDGRAERTETLASGWGHTNDYHDWAVGLPRDPQGNYYIALPCQQDDRTPAGAYLRGSGLKLIPRQPTADNPHSFDIEPFCAGLRFPMGLALSRDGALFATDNQGNYNPFNELNQLVPGARYGFINKLETAPGVNPPAREPAINIPHPWTRSVNGICFLYTPDAARAPHSPSPGTPGEGRSEGAPASTSARSVFGPFEGHLVGCEHDTRRLVRMSLQRVGDVYQGAVYPFSNEPQEGQPGLQGPISCAVAPDGDLYIGSLRDSGWGGGSNTGSLVRLRPKGNWPLGIAEVRTHARGLTVDFTGPVDPLRAVTAESYAVIAFRRISTPEYGGPDVDRHNVAIKRIDLTPDARRVTLELEALKPGFVYELRVHDIGPGGTRLQPAEAYYTLHRIPE